MTTWLGRIFFIIMAFLFYEPLAHASLEPTDLHLTPPEYVVSNDVLGAQTREIAPLIKISALVGTALLVPTMTVLGALVANPQWLLVGDIANQKSRISYIDHTTSSATIPITALFALLGSAPLFGVLFFERSS
ncbi:MAG TPA: hypothetical protein VEK06_04690 [Myxococcota bacterium]|nr:hypothetical protein [Myxococcota bacterium]